MAALLTTACFFALAVAAGRTGAIGPGGAATYSLLPHLSDAVEGELIVQCVAGSPS